MLLENECIFSIDNETTKAIDDCVSIQEKVKDKVWRIGIHISDVDCVVVDHSEVDKEA